MSGPHQLEKGTGDLRDLATLLLGVAEMSSTLPPTSIGEGIFMQVFCCLLEPENERLVLDGSSPEKETAALAYLFDLFEYRGFFKQLSDIDGQIEHIDSIIAALSGIDSRERWFRVIDHTIENAIVKMKGVRNELVGIQCVSRLYGMVNQRDPESKAQFMTEIPDDMYDISYDVADVLDPLRTPFEPDPVDTEVGKVAPTLYQRLTYVKGRKNDESIE